MLLCVFFSSTEGKSLLGAAALCGLCLGEGGGEVRRDTCLFMCKLVTVICLCRFFKVQSEDFIRSMNFDN